MSRNKKKFVIGILILVVTLISIFFLAKVINTQTRVVLLENHETTSNDEQKKIDDVVGTIINTDYQSITTLKEENSSIAYVIVGSRDSNLKKELPKVVDLADSLNIKLTFVGNDEMEDKNKPYYSTVQKYGHTILPKYLDIENILNRNNVKTINNNNNLKSLKKQDVAFYIQLNQFNDKEYNELKEKIDELNKQGYTFKALI
ncbi:hypothetical protein [Clostridium sp. Ade.TY]|uniref:hypothetical protein n=1 Tax=Clostridium sp. Ade.TY TaxID=1391647 RepID=UPI00041609B3|nr:hypothetical protein [Clostridium sp. Ade.TY]